MNLENIGNDINVNNTASTSINTEKDDEKSVNNDINIDEFNRFKVEVGKYFNYTNEIHFLKQELSEKKKKSNELESYIINYMKQNNIYLHNSEKGVVKFVKSYHKPFRSKEATKKKLEEFFNSSEKGDECFNFINNIEKVEKTRIKLIPN